YHLAGMPVTPEMAVGMVLLFVGVALTIYALFPRRTPAAAPRASAIRIAALDDAPIRPAHVGLLLTLAAAVTIDVMKPAAFSFLAPGAALEYGLRSPLHPHAQALSIALYPLAGISGMVPGAFLWGW